MHHALFLPPFGDFADPRVTAELAVAAEGAGWDGIFLWDHMWRPPDQVSGVGDVWISLAAIASATTRLRLGPGVTPLTRRRPHKVARETVTLDHLSNGRLTLGIGLGVNSAGELERFGEQTDPVVLGERLDESLELLLALWSGEEVDHDGPHFTARGVRFTPGPLQRPRIPIWAAARGINSPKPVRRAARLDGLFPVDTTVDQLARMLEIVAEERGSMDGFDVAMLVGPGSDLAALERLGVTWAMWEFNRGETKADALAQAGAPPPA